jgi:hypothetical protein
MPATLIICGVHRQMRLQRYEYLGKLANFLQEIRTFE